MSRGCLQQTFQLREAAGPTFFVFLADLRNVRQLVMQRELGLVAFGRKLDGDDAAGDAELIAAPREDESRDRLEPAVLAVLNVRPPLVVDHLEPVSTADANVRLDLGLPARLGKKP